MQLEHASVLRWWKVTEKLVKDASFAIGFAPKCATNIAAPTARTSSSKKSRRSNHEDN